jgi:hypothetical protein
MHCRLGVIIAVGLVPGAVFAATLNAAESARALVGFLQL